MRRIVLGLTLAAGTCLPALAASYDELNAGIDRYINGDWEGCVSRMTKALAGGDLVPSLVNVAHMDRALSNMALGNLSAAIDDLDAYLQAVPDSAGAVLMRARAYSRSGAQDKAEADLVKVGQMAEDAPGIARQAGLLYWEMGRFEKSNAAFSKLEGVSKSYPYGWLWLQLSNLKLGKPLNDDDAWRFNGRKWPGPVVSFYQGKTKQSDLMTTAAEGEGEVAANKLCEANYYVGEWLALKGDTGAGQPFLKKAAEECPDSYVEKSLAKSELERAP